MAAPDGVVIGWDVGGAHVKACRMRHGEVLDVVQWACPLWQGLHHLEQALESARERWSDLDRAQHAVTMTGEMVDLFAHREDGVQRIAALLAERLAGAPDAVQFFAGDAGWRDATAAPSHWQQIASANWLATARHAARVLGDREALLVDIGSTTTDLIALRAGRVLTVARSDVHRLASGELVYHGVVRTPLCALTKRIAWRGQSLNVMNEFFATAADVYRLTGELDPAHDQHPAADNAAKDLPATRARMARMIGLDERDATADEWLAFAHAWRGHQIAELRLQADRVRQLHGLAGDALMVSAGCGDFLVRELGDAGTACLAYARDVARVSSSAPNGTAAWAQVCAPSVAVAALFELERR
jgi:(4-(4-[2-(gamma-L-glutamylamino)ethyl]phenoxymethyl)furan-2-yl)methanamine synthase